MTTLLYMDSHDGTYTRRFTATVTAAVEGPEGPVVELDQTAFYPLGGGQPSDKGELRWGGGSSSGGAGAGSGRGGEGESAPIRIVRKKHRVRHLLAPGSPLPPVGASVEGVLDWDRRYGHMRMHTAQHLVSAIVDSLHGGRTVGNQVGAAKSRIDFAPLNLTPSQLRELEGEVNATLARDLPVTITTMERAELEAMPELVRANLELLPPSVTQLRVIAIGEIDLCPCAGTHVRSLKEIGQVRFTKRDNKGAGKQRLTYLLEDPAEAPKVL